MGSAVVVVLALGLAALVAWVARSPQGTDSAAPAVAPIAPRNPPEPRTSGPLEPAEAAPGSEREAREAPGPAADLVLRSGGGSRAEDPRRFAGSGTLRGHVEVSGRGPFPEVWSLVLAPSRILEGREHAEGRVVDFSAGVQDFRIPDLPLGGYDVTVRAVGLQSLPHPVLLEPANRSPFVNLRLYAAGFLAGRLMDPEGVPVSGIAVHLEAQPMGQRVTRTSDAIGRFRFAEVLDGAYLLSVGDPHNPLVEPRRLSFRAPSMNLPDIALPVLSGIRLRVLELSGEGVPHADVRGSGNRGGSVDGKTDSEGWLVVPYLPPGRYRLLAEHPSVGQGRVAIDVVEEQTAETFVYLR